VAVETSSAGTYQFGSFQVNPASGELLKRGERVRLQDQPFRLLVILLENAGQVVTREELRNRVWPDNTYVDFDSSLRVAVRKLREALGDDADKPVYVETIPKRGYRFLFPVTRVAGVPEAPTETEAVPAGVAPKNATTKPGSNTATWVWILIAVLVVGAVSSATFIHAPRTFAGSDAAVLADFQNSTGDQVFDGTLREGLEVQLEQSPYLSLVSDQRIQQTLKLMGQPAGARLTPELAREVCERTGAGAVLEGSIAGMGSQYVLGLRARDCRTGEVLDREQVQAAKKEDVLSALDRVAKRFRTRVGESLATVEKHDTPLVEATTPSLEALKAYSMGMRINAAQGEAAAVPFFKRAVELDPQFALAHAALGIMYGTLGETDLAGEETSRAYALRDRASDKEKFFITGYYEGRTTGNQIKALQISKEWAETYPHDMFPHTFLAGFVYPVLGDFNQAVDESENVIRINPAHAFGYITLASNNLCRNRVADAEKATKMAAAHGIDVPLLAVMRYQVAFLKGDAPAMDREEAGAQEKPETEEWISLSRAFALAYTGRLQDALKAAQRAEELAGQRSSLKDDVALFETAPALWEGFLGLSSAAKQSAHVARESSNGREVEYGAALALALAGDSVESEKLTDDLAKRFPEDTSVQFSYLPTVRGVLALNHGDAPRAIEALLHAAPYELGTPRSCLQGFYGALYPVYIRGEAYLAERKGAEAAAEFQKILDHRGTVVSDPIGALAKLQLARAYALMGDKTKAKAAYASFLDSWKSADPGIPVLKQAQKEYRMLR
jgi:DNA-binding winged helix-turn-helix (wHTH) protein/tetratricopeptide (TPR) repeat protein